MLKWLIVLVGLLSTGSLLADGAQIRNRLTTVDVLRKSSLIFTAQVVAIKHLFATRRAYGRLHRYISRYRIKVRLGKALRGQATFFRLKKSSPLIWLERGSYITPGKWVVIGEHYAESYGLGHDKPGAEIIVYLSSAYVDKRAGRSVVQLGYVDSLKRLGVVEQLIKSGADKKPPLRRHASCSAEKPLWTPRGCASFEGFKKARACPKGASWIWKAPRPIGLILFCQDRAKKRHGPLFRWDGRGRLKRTTNFKNGKKHGPENRYHTNGKRKSALNYGDGKLHGAFQTWHFNGKKSTVGQYLAGLYHGSWTHWDQNGVVRTTYTFKRGAGVRVRFTARGQKYSVIDYIKNTTEHGRVLQWHDNGKRSLIGRYVQGQRDGLWMRYDKSGTFKEAECYQNAKQRWQTKRLTVARKRRCPKSTRWNKP